MNMVKFSIEHLAKKAESDAESVIDDLKTLRELGIIDLVIVEGSDVTLTIGDNATAAYMLGLGKVI